LIIYTVTAVENHLTQYKIAMKNLILNFNKLNYDTYTYKYYT
jgi:hypothetical protein